MFCGWFLDVFGSFQTPNFCLMFDPMKTIDLIVRFDSDGGGYLDRDELARVFRTSHGASFFNFRN